VVALGGSVSIGCSSLWEPCRDAAGVRAVLAVERAGRIGRNLAEVAVPGQLAAKPASMLETDLLVPILLWRRC
jgi:hypothetical protein